MLVVNSPKSCPVTQSEAFSIVYGNGDYDDSQSTVSSLFLRDTGTELTELPEKTRAVIVDVTQNAANLAWRGTAEVPPSGPINVLVWDQAGTCRLSQSVEPRTDVTFGVFGRHLMVAGGTLPGSTPHTFVGDLATGHMEDLAIGLRTRRSHATITSFRKSALDDPSPALVAGGEDPGGTGSALATAEVYVPKQGAPGDIGDFDNAKIDLSEPRTKHGAVVLSSGETLLVGGIGAGTLATMEIVDPKTGRSRTNGVVNLAQARSNPTVLRLASGEIFVAGGVDRSNAPVKKLEWFSADASRATKQPADLVTGLERAYVPLEGGGVLAVVRPETGVTDFKTVWVISADGTIDPGLPIDPTTLDRVRLFPGVEGAPVLWTGRQWLRWQPWSGAFQPIPNAPTRGPRGPAIVNGDSGLALWLDDRADDPHEDMVLENFLYVRGYRFGTHTRFGTVASPLLVDGTAGLAPDRLPGSSIRFQPGRGLELGPGASAFVTDVTYADVTVEIDGGATPSIVLRQEDGREIDVGGAACPTVQSAVTTLRVERIGKRVTVQADDKPPLTCPTEVDLTARVSIGVRGAGGTGSSLAHNLRIRRR